MKKINALNKNEFHLIRILEQKGYLEPRDFERVFCLSFAGTKAKIKHFMSLKWIRVHNKNDVVYKFVKDEECPEIRIN